MAKSAVGRRPMGAEPTAKWLGAEFVEEVVIAILIVKELPGAWNAENKRNRLLR
jgi:hypothetical protein